MRKLIIAAGVAALASGAAFADSQSSNTSTNSSSNNGVVRERVVDSYCENGTCTRSVTRSRYRDDSSKRRWRGSDEYRYSRNRDDDDRRSYRREDDDDD